MTDTAILALTAIALITGAVAGYALGNKRGRDEQYIEDFIAQAQREAARRNKLGQFKRKEK